MSLVQSLSPEERAATLVLLHAMAWADGLLAEHEARYLERIREELGVLPRAPEVTHAEVARAAEVLQSAESKLGVLRLLFEMLRADGDTHPEEQRLFLELAERLGLRPDLARDTWDVLNRGFFERAAYALAFTAIEELRPSLEALRTKLGLPTDARRIAERQVRKVADKFNA